MPRNCFAQGPRNDKVSGLCQHLPVNNKKRSLLGLSPKQSIIAKRYFKL
jgi:hypothetical protein